MYENLYQTLRVKMDNGLTVSLTRPELIRIAKGVMKEQIKAASKRSGNMKPLKIPNSKRFTELMHALRIPHTDVDKTLEHAGALARSKKSLINPQHIKISNRGETSSVTTAQWIDLIEHIKHPKEHAKSGWWLEIGGRLLRINNKPDWPLYTSDFGPRGAESQKQQEFILKELNGHQCTRLMHAVAEIYNQHKQDPNLNAIMHQFFDASISSETLAWGDPKIDGIIDEIMNKGTVKKIRDVIVDEITNGGSADSASSNIGQLISSVLSKIFPQAAAPFAQKVSGIFAQKDNLLSGFSKFTHAELANGLKNLEAKTDGDSISLFVDRFLRHVVQILMARLNEIQQSEDHMDPETGLPFDQMIYVQLGLSDYGMDQDGNITTHLKPNPPINKIRLADQIIQLAVLQSLAIDTNNGKHEGFFKPVESYGERDQKQDHGPSYKKFYLSLKKYLEQGFKKPSEQNDKEKKRIKGKKLIQQMKSLLQGKIEKDVPDFLPALVSAWFLSEPLRNNLSFLTTLMLFDQIENDAVYLENDGTGKYENMYTLPHLLTHPEIEEKMDQHGNKAYNNNDGGLLTMCSEGAVTNAKQTPENKNRVRRKEAHIFIDWLCQHLPFPTQTSNKIPKKKAQAVTKKQPTIEELEISLEAARTNLAQAQLENPQNLKKIEGMQKSIAKKERKIKDLENEAKRPPKKKPVDPNLEQEDTPAHQAAKQKLIEKHIIPLFEERLSNFENMPKITASKGKKKAVIKPKSKKAEKIKRKRILMARVNLEQESGQPIVDENAQSANQGKAGKKRIPQVLGALRSLANTPSGSSISPLEASQLTHTSPGRKRKSPSSGRYSQAASPNANVSDESPRKVASPR